MSAAKRRQEIDDRIRARRARTGGFYALSHKGQLIKQTSGGLSMVGVAASINRRTGKPHEHLRARRRYFRQRFQAES